MSDRNVMRQIKTAISIGYKIIYSREYVGQSESGCIAIAEASKFDHIVLGKLSFAPRFDWIEEL